MTNTETMPAAIDPTATYIHSGTELIGHVEDWAEDPDGELKVRMKDHWVFFKDCTRADEVETINGEEAT